MKFRVVILVVLAHLLLLGLLTGRCRKPSSREQLAPSSQESVQAVPADSNPGPVAAGAEENKRPPSRSDGHGLTASTFSGAGLQLPPALATKAAVCQTGVLIDWQARRILWSQRMTEAVPMASLTKMMTALLLMETVAADPTVSLETQVQVSRAASKVGGSQVYLDPRESFSLDDLLKCIMIFSANDAAYLVGEYLGGGDVDRFVGRMNQRAGELGLKTMVFSNPHGLPASSPGRDNQGSALELAFLAGTLLKHPAAVRHSSTWLTYIRQDSKPFQLVNRNRLVRAVAGVNGMKTGYTERSKFCVAATCERNGRILVAVVTGCPSSKARNGLVADLLDWGYSQ